MVVMAATPTCTFYPCAFIRPYSVSLSPSSPFFSLRSLSSHPRQSRSFRRSQFMRGYRRSNSQSRLVLNSFSLPVPAISRFPVALRAFVYSRFQLLQLFLTALFFQLLFLSLCVCESYRLSRKRNRRKKRLLDFYSTFPLRYLLYLNIYITRSRIRKVFVGQMLVGLLLGRSRSGMCKSSVAFLFVFLRNASATY